jgi:hypothetical protein
MINVRLVTLLLAALIGLSGFQNASAKQTVQTSHRKAKKVKGKKYKGPKRQKPKKAKWGVKPKNR